MKVKNIATLFVLTLAIFSLQSCNTFKGIGQDVERLGEGMQRVD